MKNNVLIKIIPSLLPQPLVTYLQAKQNVGLLKFILNNVFQKEHSNKHNKSISNNSNPIMLYSANKMDTCKWSYVDQCFTQTSNPRTKKKYSILFF